MEVWSYMADIEQQIGQLTSMIAKLIEKVDHIDKRFDQLENRFDIEQKLNQARFDEMLKEVRNQNYVINYHRDKLAKNEEEINVVKQMLQS
jgi:chromosome segregation ATPase